MRAWTFQDPKQKKKLGEKRCPWSIGWYNEEGKKRSKKIGAKSLAERAARKLEGEIAAGLYHEASTAKWQDFINKYRTDILASAEPGTIEATTHAINHFERLTSPKAMSSIKTATIDGYIRKRKLERGRKRGSTVSPATINKELRHLRAIFNIAVDWELIPKAPKCRMVREPEKLPRIIQPNHFAAIYQACDQANRPGDFQFSACDWWRALMCFTYMTGWRVGEPLAVLWRDVDLERRVAITRHGDNKGKRDEVAPLDGVVIEHLRKIVSFEPAVFPWKLSQRAVYDEFRKIQEAAGVHLECNEDHVHTEYCHVYGFHDIRRGFATANAPQLNPVELQALMRHKSFSTTQRYIRLAEVANRQKPDLHVPEVLKVGAG